MLGWLTRRREARMEADRLIAEDGNDAWGVAVPTDASIAVC